MLVIEWETTQYIKLHKLGVCGKFAILFPFSFRWLNGLFSKGYDRRLEPGDMYEVLQDDSAEMLVADLERSGKSYLQAGMFYKRLF